MRRDYPSSFFIDLQPVRKNAVLAVTGFVPHYSP